MSDLLTKSLLGGIATWRLTHMFLYESGPFRIFRHARIKLGVVYHPYDQDTLLSYKYEITTCPYCLSVWVGASVAALLHWRWGMWAILPFVYSAVAVTMHKLLKKG